MATEGGSDRRGPEAAEDRTGEEGRLGCYVHVPFCSVKCFYCDFTAFSGQRGAVDRYLAALDREAALYEGRRPATLYVGGGTPTELGAEQLARLLALLGRRFGPVGELRESTLEANPESTDPAKLDALRDGGIGRLSLGLQTAEDRLLKAVGRRHTFEDFVRVYRAARERGFDLSVDLMYGLPGQTRAEARASLERVIALEPDHLSLYGLQIEDRTLFGKREVEVDEDLARLMYEDAISLTAAAGFRHYELSNWARPGKESLHNVNYWLDGEYAGLGCGAAGCLDGERWQNEETLKAYCGRVEAGERPVASAERLSGKEKLGETMMLRLRLLDGLTLTHEMSETFRPEIARLLERGLAVLEDAGCSRCATRLRLTREGVFLANEAFRELVPPYEREEATA